MYVHCFRPLPSSLNLLVTFYAVFLGFSDHVWITHILSMYFSSAEQKLYHIILNGWLINNNFYECDFCRNYERPEFDILYANSVWY